MPLQPHNLTTSQQSSALAVGLDWRMHLCNWWPQDIVVNSYASLAKLPSLQSITIIDGPMPQQEDYQVNAMQVIACPIRYPELQLVAHWIQHSVWGSILACAMQGRTTRLHSHDSHKRFVCCLCTWRVMQ